MTESKRKENFETLKQSIIMNELKNDDRRLGDWDKKRTVGTQTQKEEKKDKKVG